MEKIVIAIAYLLMTIEDTSLVVLMEKLSVSEVGRIQPITASHVSSFHNQCLV